jgi:hypothetical protein
VLLDHLDHATTAVMTPRASPAIESLPDELLQIIFDALKTAELKSAALVSKCFYRHASDHLWHEVALVDKRRIYPAGDEEDGDAGPYDVDDHDDTPVIEKLHILASNPILAAKVQVLTHRCHLPAPNIFSELPNMHFHAENLSQDRRLHTLLWQAVRNLVNVHTLRIIYGHFNLTKILLGAFLSPNRPHRIRLRRLWLESCSLSVLETDSPKTLSLDCLTGLESIRIRRLRAETTAAPERSKMQPKDYRLARGGSMKQMHNAAGGWLWSTVDYLEDEHVPRGWDMTWGEQLRAKSAMYVTPRYEASKMEDSDSSVFWNGYPKAPQYVMRRIPSANGSGFGASWDPARTYKMRRKRGHKAGLGAVLSGNAPLDKAIIKTLLLPSCPFDASCTPTMVFLLTSYPTFRFDKFIWEELPEIQAYVDPQMDLSSANMPQQLPVPNPIVMLLGKAASTLTSLNLDWIIWRQAESNNDIPALHDFHLLSQLRFPHLRGFQVRNAVVYESKLPDGVYLLEDTFLDFIEAHPKISCLAWPLDRFYSHAHPSTDVQNRTRRVVAHLANMLFDLRLDCAYSMGGETCTDESRTPREQQERIRRRRFIAEFAPHLCKIEQLKLEGGIPRDEKRELVRALHYSPLKKVVLIGVTFPVGNMWGFRGCDLKALDPTQGSEVAANLEEEDLEGIVAAYRNAIPVPPNFVFEPYYGWRSEAAFLQTLGLHHADTIEELKLCGYNGSPILSHATHTTYHLLQPLRHFDNLRQLVLSYWLLTFFEDSHRDAEIIQSWLDTRSPASTALVVVTPPASPTPPSNPAVDPGMMPQVPFAARRPQQFNRWQVKLKTEFSPSALAYRVAHDIGPHLSSVAKERPGGVRVRASFCLGTREDGRTANDIFDLDMRIGRNDQVLEFIGPREEAETGRCWAKLKSRQWF